MKRSSTAHVRIVQNTNTALSAASDEENQRRSGGRIGLFDSGVGGLSVLRAVARVLPHQDLVYFADTKYCPYGPRSPQEIRALSRRITKFLISQHCQVIVVACNTASAAALYALRELFPEVVFVGMEPAVKPAASATRSGKIAVLATRGTLEGELFANTRDEFARAVEVLTVYPKDWVERVERGDIDSPQTFESVKTVVAPLLDWGIDEIVLGCTHYPFLTPLIEKIAQGKATVLDPSEAVARQTARAARFDRDSDLASPGAQVFFTSGDVKPFQNAVEILLGPDETRSLREIEIDFE